MCEKIGKSTYRVKGSGKESYTVDVLANSGMGSCECMHYKMRILPKWKDGIKVDPCRHILLVLGDILWHKAHK
jgi:hypothetical protein